MQDQMSWTKLPDNWAPDDRSLGNTLSHSRQQRSRLPPTRLWPRRWWWRPSATPTAAGSPACVTRAGSTNASPTSSQSPGAGAGAGAASRGAPGTTSPSRATSTPARWRTSPGWTGGRPEGTSNLVSCCLHWAGASQLCDDLLDIIVPSVWVCGHLPTSLQFSLVSGVTGWNWYHQSQCSPLVQ